MKIKCPACSKVLSIPDTAGGKIVKCPCGKQLRAPGGPGATATSGGASASRPQASPAQKAAPKNTGAGDLDPAMFDELTDQDLKPVKAVNHLNRPAAAAAPGRGTLMSQYAPTDGLGSGNQPLASVGSRIAGALIDGVFITLFNGIGVGVAVAMMGPIGESGPSPAQLNQLIAIIVGASLVPQVINAVLISMSGQSVGKKIVRTRIVRQSTGEAAGFVHGFLLRNIVFGMLTGLPLIGIFVLIVDIVFLFKDDHETLHDKLAQTRVVRA